MRERSYNLPVPHCKALALPNLVERATQKPTQYSNINIYHICGKILHT